MDNTRDLDDDLAEESEVGAATDEWGKEEKEDRALDNLSENDEHRVDKNDISSKPSSADVRVARFECSDSTADVCWSATDPWMYATLSCDGFLVVHHVPSQEKYKILL